MEWTTEFASSRMSKVMSDSVSRLPRWFIKSGPGSTIISRAAGALLHARERSGCEGSSPMASRSPLSRAPSGTLPGARPKSVTSILVTPSPRELSIGSPISGSRFVHWLWRDMWNSSMLAKRWRGRARTPRTCPGSAPPSPRKECPFGHSAHWAMFCIL